MLLEFFSDRTTHHLDRQYTLGPSLLVAPVFVDDKEETEYYIPAGRWTSFFDSARAVDGPAWVKEKVALDEIPVWVRPGTVLLLGPAGVTKPDYELNTGLEVRVYEVGETESIEVEVPTGKSTALAGTVRVDRKGLEVKVLVNGQGGGCGVHYGVPEGVRRWLCKKGGGVWRMGRFLLQRVRRRLF